MTRRVRKAVFPVAGLGTRFLPATKLVAKEMLPVVDKPLIQYAVEECRKAGIEYFIFITGRGKAVLVDHFDHAPELESLLRDRGKREPLDELLGGLPKPGTIVATRQQEPLGLGHAVHCARAFIGDEPFAVVLPDDMVMSDRPCIGQLIEAWNDVGGNVVAVENVPADQTDKYGILDVQGQQGNLFSAKGLVEKPAVGTAPSTMAIIGRYVLDPLVMDELGRTKPGSGGEIQLTDAMNATIGKVPFHGLQFDGERFDCGDKVGFLKANIRFALERPNMRDKVASLIKDIAATL
ncbi:UTP--glucose-1-phosphate uridylyltransferase [Insolitispirillum peregrinum]|uniref:UTP--glucose-1-phosphate uridylyltransferase n=1 Tax=Insolitispirillum peregrinum TaxID=80876 RepID=A0A1N7IHQ4_9PROT|nr:UTP--glucose-1-phosphate uridylyltransferase [Insolitispirillum peregrinum]SIS36639.1 UDP-glucose pyrophosphorylase [Insolitispirillum peregrinum]